MSAIGKPALARPDICPAQRGFTLIEALVVVAIAALVSALMFPRLQGMITGQELRTARSELIMSVRETRALAIRSGAPSRFQITENGRAYQVGGRFEQTLPASVQLSSAASNGALIFYPDGTSNGGRLALANRDRRLEFVIFPTTGLIAAARQ
jgi:general secretion pathway protein H